MQDRVRRLFEFVKRFEGRPRPEELDYQRCPWHLTLSALPRSPGIHHRGGGGFDWEDETVAFDRVLLVVDRPAWDKREGQASALYDEVDRLWRLLDHEGDAVRLFVGDALLVWSKPGIPQTVLQVPLLRAGVELTFDERRARFCFLQAQEPPTFNADALWALDALSGEERRRCRALMERAISQGGCQPLGADPTTKALRELARALSLELVAPSAPHTPGPTAVLERRGVLFAARRERDLRGACDAFIDAVPHLTSVPRALSLLVGAHPPPQTAESPVAPELLFTKPANQEQRTIAERLESAGAVLVQGPPGTGKTHTIANLVGHLLGHGKTVLVTAQTPKAIGVLREQLPDELKPLCVTAFDAESADARAQLEHGIHGILSRLAQGAEVFELAAAVHASEREKLLTQLSELEREIHAALAGELEDVEAGGQRLSIAEALRRARAEGAAHAWLPGPVAPAVPLPLPLDELERLYALNAELTPVQEAQLGKGLPLSVELPSRDELARLLGDAPVAPAASEPSPIPWRAPEGSAERLRALTPRLSGVLSELEALGPWQRSCVQALLLGGAHRQTWTEWLEHFQKATTEIETLSRRLLDVEVELAPELEAGEGFSLAMDALARFDPKGGVSWLRRLGRPPWMRVLDECTVNGKPPATREALEAVALRYRLEQLRQQIMRRWEALFAKDTAPLGWVDRAKPEDLVVARMPELREAFHWGERWSAVAAELEPLGLAYTQWLTGISAEPPHVEVQRLLKVGRERLLPALISEQQRMRQESISGGLEAALEKLAAYPDSPVLTALQDALLAGDLSAYQQALAELAQLDGFRAGFEVRADSLAALREVAPAWADAVLARQAPHQGPGLPGDVLRAWEHRQIVQELERRAAVDVDALQAQVLALTERLDEVTGRMVEQRAWAHQARRTQPREHRALMTWLDLVRRIGKGTSRHTQELIGATRAQLEIARAVVPVWMMPTTKLAENFVPGQRLFDVVILDEASQCDLTALIAFALGERVVVVGDHEQVSPLGVGKTVQEVRSLQQEWLDDFDDKDLFDGRTSVYETARRSFPGGILRLVEHFRCVPDIIAFSNGLSYNGAIRPLRELFAARVFPPVVAHRVAKGKRVASTKLNPLEALEITSLVVAAAEQPEYAGLSFGVVSLLGDEQDRLMEALLQRYLPTSEYEARRLLCGTAAEFQGDERDVVFVSLVDSSQTKRLRLLDRDDVKKRYNVAASRARDQLWVVHSVDPEVDLQPRDLRRRLLEHAKEPAAWRSGAAKDAGFELGRQLAAALTARGYGVRTQVEMGGYTLQWVVEGKGGRVALTCDEEGLRRGEPLPPKLLAQRGLSRLGWRFVRVRYTGFVLDFRTEVERVVARLEALGVLPDAAAAQLASPQAPDDAVRARVVARAAELREKWLGSSGSLRRLLAKVRWELPKRERAAETAAAATPADESSSDAE